MQKSLSPSGKTYSPDSIQTSQLPRLIEGWILTCDINRCSERTLGNRRYLLGRLVWFLNDRKIGTCSTDALKQFFHYLHHGHKEPGGRWGNARETQPTKAGTAETYYRHFRTFFNYLVKEGEIETSPIEPIQKPINRPDQIQPFNDDQVKRILSAAERTTNPKRDSAIIYTLLDCALRASELLALRVEDVDLTACVLTVKSGKGGKARPVNFCPETRRALYLYLRERGEVGLEDFLFLSDRGKTAGASLSAMGLQHLVKRIGEAAGITGIKCSPHVFRHTFSVAFIRNGGNQFTLMSTLGHSSLTMTSNYVKIADADTEKQHRQFSPVANLKNKEQKRR